MTSGCRLVALAGWLCLTAVTLPARAGDLERNFRDPPASARPWVYWMWMDGNSSRDGITADLEAMRRAGIGGMILMEVDVGIPKGPTKFMSPEWRQNFKHAVTEAERLGLQITLNAGPGWTGSGGPWVKPEQSMQHLVASAIAVLGPTNLNAPLPQPSPRKPYFGTAGLPADLLKAQNDFYRDVAVLAFPTPAGNERIADVDHKALYVRDPYSSMPGVKPFIPAPADFPPVPDGAAVASENILDLTSRLDADGRLNWTVPPGNWTVMRFGRTSTGANTRPAPAPGLGLECDKFDKAALDAHFEDFIGSLLREVGRRKRKDVGWTSLHIDSWEMGAQNWTAAFREEFRKRRGYDPLRYLPAMAGRVVESLEVSERFLWDVRQTAQELVIENHAQHLKELGRRRGLRLSIEPYDMDPTADLNLGAAADVPMCEFWANCFESWYSCFEAASIAHTGGKRIVAAESFTSDDKERWLFHPGGLKALGDWAFCAGVNRIVFHRYAHQPWLDRWPGMTMGPYGVHWERTQTWWDMVPAYHEYLARCQFLLRQGEAVADILYLTPEGAPQVFRPPKSAVRGNPPDHREYNFDACSPETLLARTKVKGGQIAFPGGSSYRLLALPNVDTMTPGLLRKVKELAHAGATVVGLPPRKSPSLANYPQCDEEIRELADKLWGGPAPNARPRWNERRVGRGRLLWDAKQERSDTASAPLTGPLDGAKWIWFNEGNPSVAAPVAKRYFRRVFVLPDSSKVETATASLTADNSFELWVNGRRAGSGDNFTRISEFEIGARLKPGTNVLAVTAENGGDSPNPAGLIAVFEVHLIGGAHLSVRTDREWLASTSGDKNWQLDGDAGAVWTAAKELGDMGMSPWGNIARPTVEPEIYQDYNLLASVLRDAGVPPDFESNVPLRYTHRRDGDTEIYFVANPEARQVTATVRFRVAGRQPEFWWPDTGRIQRAASYGQQEGRTTVPLRIEPHGSVFAVFRKPARSSPSKPEQNWDDFSKVQEISGPWDVHFQIGRGAPETTTLDRLVDWSKHSNPGVKFFSGIATYGTTFRWPPGQSRISNLKGGTFLDLGRVEVMAQVKLNGKVAGVAWKPPFRLDITKALKPGANELEITVANLWPNRLIGDAGLPKDERVTWTTWSPFTKDTPLLESGLLGPVTLLKTHEVAAISGGPRPLRPFFAFCMDTHDARKRSLAEQAGLLKELGYDGAGHLWLDGLEERLATLDEAGLKLFQVYLRVDIKPGAKAAYDPRLREKLPLLKGRNTMLALLVSGGKPSDATLDEGAVTVLRELADLTRPYGVRVVLYPHVNDWLERTEDAVRVAAKVDRPNLGVMFNLCHWLKVGDESQLKPVLQAAKPYLMAVSINGSDHAADIRAGTGQWIAPLDAGAFDQRDLLRALDEIGFQGPVGLQCYGIPGDARVHLQKSIQAWRKLNEQPSAAR